MNFPDLPSIKNMTVSQWIKAIEAVNIELRNQGALPKDGFIVFTPGADGILNPLPAAPLRFQNVSLKKYFPCKANELISFALTGRYDSL